MKPVRHVLQHRASFSLKWEIFERKILEEINTHISWYVLSETCAVYVIMSKHVVEPERPQMKIWRRLCMLDN
jgi:hypothetical protein